MATSHNPVQDNIIHAPFRKAGQAPKLMWRSSVCNTMVQHNLNCPKHNEELVEVRLHMRMYLCEV